MAVFKNESMILREWIEHYKWQGMDMIVLLNNDSTDDWQSIVKDYPDLVFSRDCPGKYIQLQSYNTIGLPLLREHKVDVLAILDIDEYMFGTDGKNLNEHIQETFTKEDRPSAFTCGWSMFGSNGHKTQPVSIRKAFTKRWQENAEPESGISGKTVMLLSDIKDISCIHIPDTEKRRDSCPPGLQLNHYPVMSEEYFKKVKMTRGDAFTGNYETARNMDYFIRYDNNNIDDEKLANLVTT